MKRFLIAGATVAAAAAAVPAQAAPVIFFTPGVYNLSAVPYTVNATTVESFEDRATGSQLTLNANESKTGTVTVQSGNIPNVTADPDPANSGGTQYIAIGANNGTSSSFTYNFTTPVQFLSFILGSLDTYNTLTLTFNSGASPITYTGAQIVGLAPAAVGFNGNGNSSLSGRVSYDAQGGPAITSATFGSTFAAFEIDAISAAVPEPGAWALMILGVGFAGASLRTRRRKVTFATA